MSKDQALGAFIFLVCVILAVGYAVLLFAPSVVSPIFGVSADAVRFWAVAIVVLIAVVAVLLIGAWIGWTLATTPPPQPLEDIGKELEKETKPEGEGEP